MKRQSILPLGTPDAPQRPAPIEPRKTERPGPSGDRIELAIIVAFAVALIIRGCWPW